VPERLALATVRSLGAQGCRQALQRPGLGPVEVTRLRLLRAAPVSSGGPLRPTCALTLDAFKQAADRHPLLTPRQEVLLSRAVRRWLDWPGPESCPPGVARHGRRARERLINSNIRLVLLFANRLKHLRGAEFDDLVQGGIVGLCRAADKFDAEKGYKFSTYATMWVRSGMQKHALRHRIQLSVPASHAERLDCITAATRHLRDALGREPTLAEVEEALKLKPGQLEPLLQAAWLRAHSLDAPAPGGGGLHDSDGDALGDLLTSPEPLDPGPARRALAAIEQHDADVAALLELAASGHKPGELAVLLGETPQAASRRLSEARERLRALPEVELALAG